VGDIVSDAQPAIPAELTWGSLEAVTEPDDRRTSRLDLTIAVLLAIVAVTAALAAWRTAIVGSSVTDTNRIGLIDVSKRQTLHHINESAAFGEAEYAVQAALKSAEAKALLDSTSPALAAAGKAMEDNLVPGMQQLAGPFPSGQYTSATGTFDVAARVTALGEADAGYQEILPEVSFALADEYANEKRWLTVLSVVLAIALFWLGMSEITSGRWRLVNLVIGVAIWVVSLGFFIVIETWFITGRGGVL
jgi:hypothetical protein